MKIPLSLCCATALVLFTGCGNGERKAIPGDHALRVVTSIVPQVYFVERVGGKRVIVDALVKPGQNPATYEPTPRQMAALSQADLFVRIGVPFENALLPKLRASMPNVTIVDEREGVALRQMTSHRHDGNEHEYEYEHEYEGGHEGGHEGMDPHIWTDPRRVIIQARTIRDALIEHDPAGRADYERNCAAFVEKLEALDRQLREALTTVRGETLFVFHPSWGYFAEAYGLHQMAVEVEGKEPTVKQLAQLIEKARREEIKVVFVQPQFSQKAARRIADAVGCAVVPIDPLEKNLIANLQTVANQVRNALSTDSK